MSWSTLRRDEDLEGLVRAMGDARVLLLGEASHGTHEYYDWRARLTRRLLRTHDVRFVAVEGDWPDAYRLNQYVRAYDGGPSAARVLERLTRWPTWMWANQEVAAFGDALRRWNDRRPERERVGFYGLDLYSLRESLAAILEYLRQRDGALVQQAREVFECFDTGGGRRSLPLAPRECRDELTRLLEGLQRRHGEAPESEEAFAAESNAWAAMGAERYYRSLVEGDRSWNIRDHHMQDMLSRLRARFGFDGMGIVWAHNTHVGDARATDMAQGGLVNLGQLARQAWRTDVFTLGFGSYAGDVVAARAWDEEPEVMQVPRARTGSVEARLHEAHAHDGWLDLGSADETWHEALGHRAIGVVYHPEWEAGNYVPTRLAKRYDAFVFLDRTRSLEPLRHEARQAQTPQTLPSGF